MRNTLENIPGSVQLFAPHIIPLSATSSLAVFLVCRASDSEIDILCSVLKMFILNRVSGRVALKASRTWLPDHRFWIVPPRTAEYSTGGWYIERAGAPHAHSSKVDLHPGIACCLLGVQALGFETGINVPWWLRGTLQAAQSNMPLLPGRAQLL